jgi:hypothetical protein
LPGHFECLSGLIHSGPVLTYLDLPVLTSPCLGIFPLPLRWRDCGGRDSVSGGLTFDRVDPGCNIKVQTLSAAGDIEPSNVGSPAGWIGSKDSFHWSIQAMICQPSGTSERSRRLLKPTSQQQADKLTVQNLQTLQASKPPPTRTDPDYSNTCHCRAFSVYLSTSIVQSRRTPYAPRAPPNDAFASAFLGLTTTKTLLWKLNIRPT